MDIAVLPGDDIGPEITAATVRVLEAVDAIEGLGLVLRSHPVGMAAHREFGTTLPEPTLAAARAADGIVLGPGGMNEYPPLEEGGINISGAMRKTFDLYANIRPSRARRGIPAAREGLDCVIVRENTQGFYADRNLFVGQGEFMPTPDSAMSLRLITRDACRRIAEVAFRQASARGSNLTVVGKRHVLQLGDGIFLEAIEEVGAKYPDIEIREMDIDAMASDLYLAPHRFDVIVTTNMFGDILSNLAAALSGGLGLGGALNAGDTHAAANAAHGSAPDIAGLGIANPTSLMISASMLLRWWGARAEDGRYVQAANRIERALDGVLESQVARTRDVGGTATTVEFTDAVLRALDEQTDDEAGR